MIKIYYSKSSPIAIAKLKKVHPIDPAKYAGFLPASLDTVNGDNPFAAN